MPAREPCNISPICFSSHKAWGMSEIAKLTAATERYYLRKDWQEIHHGR